MTNFFEELYNYDFMTKNVINKHAMMINFEFQINKKVCFAYWIQSMINWDWRFDVQKFKHYENIVGKFNNEEKEALKQLKEILQREPDGGYLWLWDRYAGNIINNEQDIKIWRNVKKFLGEKFEIIWNTEYPKLLIWKKRLEKYSFEDLNKIFISLSAFFSSQIDQKIVVQLSLFYKKTVLYGCAKKEFKNLFMLNISNLQKDFLPEAINTIAHETVHQIDYLSNKNMLLKKSFLKIFKPHSSKYKFKKLVFRMKCFLRRKKEGPSWSHLISESIITSIAGTNNEFNYLNQKLFSRENPKDEKKFFGIDYKNIKYNYSCQIMTIARSIEDLTKEYLDNNREMDSDYADHVAQAWLDFRM